MIKQSVNTFIKGMVKDIDKSVMSKDSYLDALNFRTVTSEGSSSGAFENIKGNKLISSLYGFNDLFVCGSVRLRDYVVIFMTTNTGVPVHGVGQNIIFKVYINNTTEEINGIPWILYNDNTNAGVGTDTLDFSTMYPIKAIARYETPNIQKVYFTDGYNNLRYIDIGKNLTITGEAYLSNNYMPTSMFEFLPEFIPSKPTLKDIVGGTLMSGMVQYSYQLYRINGAETAFSPVSGMIHIVTDNDFAASTINYKGDGESIETGKGCKISIVNSNSGYDRLRLVRIHYSTLNSIPVINVASEIEITTSPSTIEVIDVGETINSLTLDEFTISSTELFTCEDIATKDNRLFAANIKKSDFKSNQSVEDFDARAVRYKSNQTSYVDINNYPTNDDGINPFNDPGNDGNSAYAYKYQANGTTIGAEGLNVKIDFETELIVLDNSNIPTSFSTTSDSSSYSNFASPWMDGKLSWQRDEVYRLFVVWKNTRSQESSPQWIIDLRMPSMHDDDFTNTSGATVYPSVLTDNDEVNNITYTHILRPRILFKNKPADAVSCQIYRVKRDKSDRSIITQGLALPSKLESSTNYPDISNVVIPTSDSINLIKLVSPEINILKNISKSSNDYIEYITYFSRVLTTNDEVGTFHRRIYKLVENTKVSYNLNNISTIGDIIPISPSSAIDATNIVMIDAKPYLNYNQDGSHTYSKGSSGLLVSYNNTSWSAEGTAFCLVNYKSNIFGSQYGGNTFESRSLNVGIPCSDIIATLNTWNSIKYGDTFINYFDVSTMLVDLAQSYGSDSVAESIYIPLESSVNCDLRHDTSSSHANFTGYTALSVMRQEYAGTHSRTVGPSTVYYNQKDDLYLYNTIYSQQTSAQYALSSMIDVSTETTFDCLVKASNIKYNGENSDSWTKFNLNEEIEVDANYGPIKALNVINDKLLYWQEDAFGILSVNDRSLIQDASSSQLVLGTGGILARYDYVSSTVGILNKFSLVNSDSTVYWFYDKDTSIYRFNNKLSNLSKEKGMWSWFNNNYNSSQIVHGVFDRKYNEILFTFFGVTNGTIGFSEQTDEFEPFRSFVPRMYIDGKEFYISVIDSTDPVTSLFYYHNSDINQRCEFYGTIYPSTVKILYNADYLYTKIFDNIMYISNAFDEDTDVEQYGITFDKVRCYNDYQNSDWVTLTYPTNIMRRDRGWTITVPRNLVDHTYTTSPDIFTDLDTGGTTKVWKERIRDKYMILDLSFDNNNDTRFVVPFIGCKYRLSYR
jgi:hypothetical protein